MVTTSVPVHRSRIRTFLAALLSSRTAALPADCALVVVRAVLAFIFIYHGGRRLFGWFGGAGRFSIDALLERRLAAADPAVPG